MRFYYNCIYLTLLYVLSIVVIYGVNVNPPASISIYTWRIGPTERNRVYAYTSLSAFLLDPIFRRRRWLILIIINDHLFDSNTHKK